MIRVITGSETAKRLAVSLNCKVSASEQKILGFQSDFSCGSLMNLVRRTLSHYFLYR